jgi:hypothetical protein
MSKWLEDTKVYRCGKTAKSVNFETKKVRLSPHGYNGSVSKTVGLFVEIDSKGGGKTEIYVDIHEGDFARVVDALVAASPASALPAMAAAVARRLEAQPKYDAEIREGARTALVSKAKENLDSAASERDELERIVYRGVQRLADQVREAEKPKSDDQAAEE